MRWPSREEVDAAVRQWAQEAMVNDSTIQAVGYFGSYARGDAGVGSDLDLIVILQASDRPFHQRSLAWQFSEIPVPVESVVYTQSEWQQMVANPSRFYQTLMQEAVWVAER
ncbi:MAG: nucleotidyltransferase domain-containing protein [Elainellaceae cyanobacterium]